MKIAKSLSPFVGSWVTPFRLYNQEVVQNLLKACASCNSRKLFMLVVLAIAETVMLICFEM